MSRLLRHMLLVAMTLATVAASAQAEGDSIADPIADSIADVLTTNKIVTVDVPETVDTVGWVATVQQPRTLYDLPYSYTRRMHDWQRLASNTTVFTLCGVATLYILETLPEDATAWNKKELKRMGLFERWKYHADKGIVWDKDNPIFNYILHPYGGAVYYMSARSCGFNVLGSLAYSTFVSAFLWEYGIECFNEIPSVQDLFITPVAGMVVGECFYRIKRTIVANNYHLFGSWFLGHMVAWIVDPLNEFVGLISGNPCKNRNITMTPVTIPSPGASRLGLSVSVSF